MDGSAIALPNEQALVLRATAEPEAFAPIYNHYFPRVYNYVRYRVQDAGAADDVTAQVFEKALVGLGRYQPQRGLLVAWLLRSLFLALPAQVWYTLFFPPGIIGTMLRRCECGVGDPGRAD